MIERWRKQRAVRKEGPVTAMEESWGCRILKTKGNEVTGQVLVRSIN